MNKASEKKEQVFLEKRTGRAEEMEGGARECSLHGLESPNLWTTIKSMSIMVGIVLGVPPGSCSWGPPWSIRSGINVNQDG